tara:strand:+ start:314 stop:577 length:264 start_codon:yes stop_codon:yes gene_type:complete
MGEGIRKNAIKLKILVFGPLAEKMGTKEIEVAVDEGCTASALAERFEIREMLSSGLRIAINGKIIDNHEVILGDGNEVAFLPPVSGG